METHVEEKPQLGQGFCPFLWQVQTGRISPVRGYCRGLPNGMMMIPTVEQFGTQCSTARYSACPIYRSRIEKVHLPAWLQAEYQWWALPPLHGEMWSCLTQGLMSGDRVL